MGIRPLIKFFKEINICKSIYFNLHYFPLKTAVNLPVLVYRRTKLHRIGGEIKLNCKPAPGLVKLGPHGLGTQDKMYSRTIWECNGTLVVNGMASIGRGSKISIGEEGKLILGHDFTISGRSEIICQQEITFGDGCLLSWDILVMDNDSHHITDKDGNSLPGTRPIKIGNHVWICCRSTVLKGVTIADDTIISATSTITRSFHDTNCAIGGSGKDAKIVKSGINWQF